FEVYCLKSKIMGKAFRRRICPTYSNGSIKRIKQEPAEHRGAPVLALRSSKASLKRTAERSGCGASLAKERLSRSGCRRRVPNLETELSDSEGINHDSSQYDIKRLVPRTAGRAFLL